MQAPSQAWISPGSQPEASHKAWTVCSSTPPARPRQPACAPPTAFGAANSTGRQSATWMAQPSPGMVLMHASALGTRASGRAHSGFSVNTLLPCT